MSPDPAADPLAALKDIHLPEAIAQWPPAPGWWVLAALLLCVLLGLLWWLRRRWRQNAYRRAALHELSAWQQLSRQQPDPSRDLQHLNQLLRRVVRHAYPQDKNAALTGHAWVDYLKRRGADDEVFEHLAQAAYRAQPTLNTAQLEQLHRASQRWLRRHEARRC